MKDVTIRFCIAALNLISVVLMLYQAPAPETRAERFLRGILAIAYMITMFLFVKGENDEDNNREDDEM